MRWFFSCQDRPFEWHLFLGIYKALEKTFISKPINTHFKTKVFYRAFKYLNLNLSKFEKCLACLYSWWTLFEDSGWFWMLLKFRVSNFWGNFCKCLWFWVTSLLMLLVVLIKNLKKMLSSPSIFFSIFLTFKPLKSKWLDVYLLNKNNHSSNRECKNLRF